MIVEVAASSTAFAAASQNAAQPHAHPRVQDPIDGTLSTLEVTRPASQPPVQPVDNPLQTVSVASPGFFAQHFLEPFYALVARPFVTAFQVPAQKLEASGLAGVHDFGLGRM